MHLAAEARSLRDGTTIFASPLLPGTKWEATHDPHGYEPGRQFTDELTTPFLRKVLAWRHVHRFEPAGPTSTRMIDTVDTRIPDLAGAVSRTLAYRGRQLAGDLAAHTRLSPAGSEPLTVAVTGSSGLVGSALTGYLTTGGHRVVRLTRTPLPPGSGGRLWNPFDPDPELLAGVDALVHLAGAPIAGRFSAAHKQLVRDSRVGPTRRLAELAARSGVRVMACASAVGFYGPDRGDEVLTEESEPGRGFLAQLVSDWEHAADPARLSSPSTTRVVNVRTGLVQSPAGGLLRPLRMLFSAGLGGRFGNGKQWAPWIGIDDLLDVYLRCLIDDRLEGPVNAVAPNPVTNAAYTATLAHVLRRPAAVPVPGRVPALLLGREGASEFALAGQRAVPAKLVAAGHTFRYPDLEPALRHVLGRTKDGIV